MVGQLWNKPITVETRKTGQRLTISSAEQAIQYMAQEWPTIEEGQAFNAAKQALLAAEEGKIETEAAREAFLAALNEGEIFIYGE
jgi:hypothetical protein